MICPYPKVVRNAGHVPCGRCINCRINRRRMKTARLYLESLSHPSAVMATLTYAEQALTWGENGPVLYKPDFTNFMKRYRHSGYVRYAMCGEYGDKFGRPHFHAILYSKPFTQETADELQAAWPHGFVDLRPATLERFAYVASYVVKKWTKFGKENIDGRPDEYATFSKRPALGTAAILELVSAHKHRHWFQETIRLTGDVPRVIRIASRKYPLDSQMLNVMRDEVGIPRLARDREDGAQGPKDPITHDQIWRAARQVLHAEKTIRSRAAQAIH